MIRWQTIRQRWRTSQAVSTVVLAAGLIAGLTVLWLGLDTYNTLRSTRSTIDPVITAALAAAVTGETAADGTTVLPPGYVEYGPEPWGSGTFAFVVSTIVSNLETDVTQLYPATALTPCPTISGLSASDQQAMTDACQTNGFAWAPPASWTAGYHLAGPLVIGDVQADPSTVSAGANPQPPQLPYAVSLFGTTYVESQPVVAAELWIPVQIPLIDVTPGTIDPMDVPITTVIQVPIFFTANLS